MRLLKIILIFLVCFILLFIYSALVVAKQTDIDDKME